MKNILDAVLRSASIAAHAVTLATARPNYHRINTASVDGVVLAGSR